MVDKLEHLLQMEREWQIDRPSLKRKNEDPVELAKALQKEVSELMDALASFETKRTIENYKDVCQELADAQKFVLALTIALNVDLYFEVMEKHAFNIYRYPASEFGEETDYDEVYPRLKALAKKEQMRETFYPEFGSVSQGMLGLPQPLDKRKYMVIPGVVEGE